VTAFPPRYFSLLRGKALGKAKDIFVVFGSAASTRMTQVA
jgi:hypothetical protein